MSAWAKPGVKCVCIADASHVINSLGFPLFRRGQIFTIARIDHDPKYGVFLAFEELDPRHTGHIDGFRPLVTRTQEQDVAMFRRLVEPERVGA